MKGSFLARVLAAFVVCALPTGSARAAFSPKEQWVAEQISAGRTADLAAPGLPFGGDRTLDAGFLRDLLTKPSVAVPAHGVRVRNATFTNALDLENEMVPRDVRLVACVFEQAVVLDRCEFKTGLGLDGSDFRGPLSFRRGRVADDFTAEQAQFRQRALFQGLKVNGSLWLKGAEFQGQASFGYSVIGEELCLEDARFHERTNGVEFYRSSIAGLVKLDGAVFHGPANFIQMEVRGNLQAFQASFLDTSDLAAQTMRQSHYNADFGSLRVDGFAFFVGTRFDGEVSFRNAQLARLYLDEVSWPTRLDRANSVRLEWMRFSSIQATTNFAVSESNRASTQWRKTQTETWRSLKPILANHLPYSADVYQSLETYFKREGASGLAREVGYESERQHRRKVLWTIWTEKSPGWERFKAAVNWVWNWLLQITVGHGHYPLGALAWSAGIVLLGCAIFRIENMRPVPGRSAMPIDPRKAGRWRRWLAAKDYTYHAFWYSLDMFVPFIDLQARDDWMPNPENRLAWHYLGVHRTLGTILVPIGIAAFSGIIK